MYEGSHGRMCVICVFVVFVPAEREVIRDVTEYELFSASRSLSVPVLLFILIDNAASMAV